jgi:acetate---CoA ligase (ADP-forming)
MTDHLTQQPEQGTAPWNYFFAPRSVAVVGASSRPDSYAGRIIPYLLAHGFPGSIWPINPHHRELHGLEAFGQLSDTPSVPDVVVVALGAHSVAEACEAAAMSGASFVIVLGSFPATESAAARLTQLAKEYGTRFLGPTSAGLISCVNSAAISLCSTLATSLPLPVGKIAIVSQSGGLLGSLLDEAIARHVGLSHLISTGEQADITVLDLTEALLSDPHTEAISLVIEGLEDIARLERLANAAAARGKHLVLLKSGRSPAGAQAARTHSASLAVSHRSLQGVLTQFGIHEASTLPELLIVPELLIRSRGSRESKQVAVISDSGGMCALAADICDDASVPLAQFGGDTVAALAAEMPGYAGGNPVDLTAHNPALRDYPNLYRRVVEILSGDPHTGVILIATAVFSDMPAAILSAASAALQREVELLVYVEAAALGDGVADALQAMPVTVVRTAQECATALRTCSRSKAASAPPDRQAHATATDPEPVAGVYHLEPEVKRWLSAHGVAVPRSRLVRSRPEGIAALHEIGPPVVAKLASREVVHKTRAGAVVLNIHDESQLGDAFSRLSAITASGWAPDEGVLIEEQVSESVELFLGIRRDSQLGLLMLLGAGGVGVEARGDFSVRRMPVTAGDVDQMLDELELWRACEERSPWRLPPRSLLVREVLKIAGLVDSMSSGILELDINPLAASASGVVAIDARAVTAHESAGALGEPPADERPATVRPPHPVLQFTPDDTHYSDQLIPGAILLGHLSRAAHSRLKGLGDHVRLAAVEAVEFLQPVYVQDRAEVVAAVAVEGGSTRVTTELCPLRQAGAPAGGSPGPAAPGDVAVRATFVFTEAQS